MFEKPSLTMRLIIGKTMGLLIGLSGFIRLPYFLPDADLMLRFGFLFWYTTFGAIMGLVGVFAWNPVLKLPMPWWARGIVMGGWLNFVLTLFIYDLMAEMLIIFFGPDGLFLSPFWFVVEGILMGLLIEYFATRYGGEGHELALPQAKE